MRIRRRGRDSAFAQLREERRRTRAIGECPQGSQSILGPERQHRAERVGINTHTAKLVQQDFERSLVCQPRLFFLEVQ